MPVVGKATANLMLLTFYISYCPLSDKNPIQFHIWMNYNICHHMYTLWCFFFSPSRHTHTHICTVQTNQGEKDQPFRHLMVHFSRWLDNIDIVSYNVSKLKKKNIFWSIFNAFWTKNKLLKNLFVKSLHLSQICLVLLLVKLNKDSCVFAHWYLLPFYMINEKRNHLW